MSKDRILTQRGRVDQPCAAARRPTRMVMLVIVTLPLAMITMMAVGCGSRRPGLGRVAGTVTLDGQPLAHGTLTFEARGLRPATARIVDGRIVEATTFRAGDGVPVGAHTIAVFAREAGVGTTASDPGTAGFAADGMVGRSLVPRRYNHPATSGLSATIVGGTNTLDLALTRDPP
jgi:hypothetical protein